MGMFDYLRCALPLPGGPGNARVLRFQTKSLGCGMDEYRIDESGVLWGEDYDVVDHGDPAAGGLAGLAEALVRENVRARAMDGWSGTIHFHTDYGIKNAHGWGARWLEYEACVENGRVKAMRLIADIPNPFI